MYLFGFVLTVVLPIALVIVLGWREKRKARSCLSRRWRPRCEELPR